MICVKFALYLSFHLALYFNIVVDNTFKYVELNKNENNSCYILKLVRNE